MLQMTNEQGADTWVPINVTRCNDATRELMKRLMGSYQLPPKPEIDPSQPPCDPVSRRIWEETYSVEREQRRSARASMRLVRESLPENRVEPNDKLTKTVFDPSDDILSSREFVIVERYDKKGNPRIKTPVSFQSEIDRFDAHDREVGMACFVLQWHGNTFATTEQIYRVMTNNPAARLYDKEEKRIQESLERLVGSTIRIDMSGIYSMGYQGSQLELFGSILPARYVTGVCVNGSTKTVVQFLDESPLVTVAKVKNNQLLTYCLASANSGEKASPDRISLVNYARRRIEECRVRPQMTPTITFDDLFEKNGLSGKSKAEKKRYRDYLCQCFDIWKERGIVTDYELVMSGGRAHGYHGISFSF